MKILSLSSHLKKCIISLLLFSFFFLQGIGANISQAALIDNTTKEMCNQVMINIYHDIVSVKDKYPELVNFSEESLYENKHGLYTLVYEIDDPKITKQNTPFAFGLTVELLEESIFPKQQGSFAFPFPLIKVKLSGYQSPYLRSTQFNLTPLVEKNGLELALFQQKEMPLRLYLRPIKGVYKVNEPIEFEVILKNVGKTHFYVRELDPQNLYFLYNNTPWGTRPKVQKPSPNEGGKNLKIPRKTLRAGESLSLIMKGNSFRKPQDVAILGVYKMNINGVTPSGLLNIRVEK